MSFLLETRVFNPRFFTLEETLFHNANGYIGVRASFEEGLAETTNSMPGTYLNAFHDTYPIPYSEKLHGFPEVGERILNITDVQGVRVRVDGQQFQLTNANSENYRRFLNMREGLSGRDVVWETSLGKRLKVQTRRLASLSRPEIFALEYRLSAQQAMEVEIESGILANMGRPFDPSDPRTPSNPFHALEVVSSKVKDNTITINSRTKTTGILLAVRVEQNLRINGVSIAPSGHTDGKQNIYLSWKTWIDRGATICLKKIAFFSDSIRHHNCEKRLQLLSKAFVNGNFETLRAEQEAKLVKFWEIADIRIEGDEISQRGLRFNIFNLYQCAPRVPNAGIPAKGLSGEGYEGHYFWDAEIYMLPFFIYTQPQLARNLLLFRYSTLGHARNHAKRMGHSKGAAYPWRTITGRECSSHYPTGSAQYHINADIAYAIWRYWEVSNDIDFIVKYGAELLFETARIWLEIGNFTGDGFHINTVTGPDEYTCLVNDNYYTNIMARKNLETASNVYMLMERTHKSALEKLKDSIELEESEVSSWQLAAKSMALPYDEKMDINPQDESFLRKPKWKLDLNARSRPLLLDYHPLTLSRFQICKQADTVLAYVLLDTEESDSTIRNSYEYYEKITTHDSSLSGVAFSILAGRLGDSEKAYKYFRELVVLDLENTHGNTWDGIHAANMGGSWLAAVWGFGGFLPKGPLPSFSPRLPDKWKSMAFSILYRNSLIGVEVNRGNVRLSLRRGEPCEVELYGDILSLKNELQRPVAES